MLYWKATNSGAGTSVRLKAREDAALRRDLFGKIHWDCGKPNFSTLRQELEERLIVVGRDRFNLPALEARRLADVLVYRVLEKSIATASQDRVLTRAMLHDAIDAATRLSIPRAAADALTQVASDLMQSLGRASGSRSVLAAEETGWLIDGHTLPTRRGMLPRKTVESTVGNTLEL